MHGLMSKDIQRTDSHIWIYKTKYCIISTSYPTMKGVIVMADQSVTGDQYRSIDRRLREIMKQVDKGQLDPEDLGRMLQAVIDRRPNFYSPVSVLDRHHCLFRSARIQHANIVRWNEKYGWGFSAEELAAAKLWSDDAESWRGDETLSYWPKDDRSALVLVPYLKSVWATFRGLQAVITNEYPRVQHSPGRVTDLRLAGHLQHQPGLRWEWLHLGAERSPDWETIIKGPQPDGAPDEPAQSELQTLAHAQVLAAAAHFPEWNEMRYQGSEPRVWMAGYQMDVRSDVVTLINNRQWEHTPILMCNNGFVGTRVYPSSEIASHDAVVATAEPARRHA